MNVYSCEGLIFQRRQILIPSFISSRSSLASHEEESRLRWGYLTEAPAWALSTADSTSARRACLALYSLAARLFLSLAVVHFPTSGERLSAVCSPHRRSAASISRECVSFDGSAPDIADSLSFYYYICTGYAPLLAATTVTTINICRNSSLSEWLTILFARGLFLEGSTHYFRITQMFSTTCSQIFMKPFCKLLTVLVLSSTGINWVS